MGTNKVVDGGEVKLAGNYVGHKYSCGKTTIYVYFPNDGNGNTEIDGTLYYPGNNGYRKTAEHIAMSNYYGTGSRSDAFVAIENTDYANASSINTILKYLSENKGISINLNNYACFSYGGQNVLKRFEDFLDQNHNVNQVDLTLYDPYGNFPRHWLYGNPRGPQSTAMDAKDSSGKYINYNPTLIAKMKKNGSVVRVFTPKGRESDFIGTRFLNSMARNGIPTVLISANISHPKLLKVTTADGWKDYFAGSIELSDIKDSSGYKIYVPTVDASGKVTWNKYTLAKLKEAKLNPSKASEDLLKALEVLEEQRIQINFDYMNEVGTIGVSASSLSGLSSAPAISFTSSSSLLSTENQLLASIYASARNIGDALQKEISLLTTSADEYLSLEYNLRRASESLNVNLDKIKEPIKLPDMLTEPSIETNPQGIQENTPSNSGDVVKPAEDTKPSETPTPSPSPSPSSSGVVGNPVSSNDDVPESFEEAKPNKPSSTTKPSSHPKDAQTFVNNVETNTKGNILAKNTLKTTTNNKQVANSHQNNIETKQRENVSTQTQAVSSNNYNSFSPSMSNENNASLNDNTSLDNTNNNFGVVNNNLGAILGGDSNIQNSGNKLGNHDNDILKAAFGVGIPAAGLAVNHVVNINKEEKEKEEKNK